MKKKNLKKLITLGVLVLVLGGLIAGYLVQKNINEKKAAEEAEGEADTSFVVFDKGTSIVTALTFVSEDENLAFSYINDNWVYEGDNRYPLDQEGVAKMAAAIGTISAQAKVENVADDMSKYGFDEPSLTVDATFSDGSNKTFCFGEINSFNSCQYLSISGDENVYMVSSDVAYPFATDLDTLYKAESYQLQKDSVTDDEVSSITINVSGTAKEITDDTGISELYELVYTLDLSQWEDYYADSEEMETVYGIIPERDSITVSYTVETESDGKTTKVPKTYTLYIGADYEISEEDTDPSETADDDSKPEKYYFYSFEGSTVVYAADGETVDDIFAFLAYEPATEETAVEE